MIDMTHDCHHRSSLLVILRKVRFVLFNKLNFLLKFHTNQLNCVFFKNLKLIRDDIVCILANDLEYIKRVLLQILCKLIRVYLER